MPHAIPQTYSAFYPHHNLHAIPTPKNYSTGPLLSPATQAIAVKKNSFFHEHEKHPLHFQNGDRKTGKRK